jgi:L-seryl-tRNA(Ser) seleniumtransferase
VGAELARWREAAAAGAEPPSVDAVAQAAVERLRRMTAPRLVRVINATGVVLHTGLGRAPLAREAVEAVTEVAAGYSNLEFDLASGRRGQRWELVAPLLAETVGAGAALVVNNNAGAVLLVLAALAAGREVVGSGCRR